MDQLESPVQMQAAVRGLVQGVGYRLWAQRLARSLGISGYVRNLEDGSVEVVGEGPRESLEQFLAVLRRGPAGAEVRSVQVTWAASTGRSDRFEIRR
jgi:acylphosphatase